MANTANSFAALLGAGGEAAINAGARSKKKKNKGKKPGPADSNGTASEGDIGGSAPVAKTTLQQNPVSSNDQHAPNSASMGFAVEDAIKHIEKAARETPPADCPLLWKAWSTELEAVKAGRGVQYTSGSGPSLNFQQVLVKSSALELAAEAALLMENNAAQRDLANLFSLSFPPSADFLPGTFAELVFRLGSVSASDSTVRQATKKAVNCAVAALKVKYCNHFMHTCTVRFP